ncbi:peptidoglycan-binding protein [Clostridium sp. 19966]|nr:peptidoglycan-binding protein [Clostridium sp. 19966]
MIMVKSDSSIDNSLATASDTLSPGQVDYVDVYYFRDSGSIETAAHQRNTDIYYIGYATVHRDYVGYGHITSGDAVYTAQSLLVNDKYYLAIDGLFGPDTNYFVKLFQGNKNLSQDGIVGPQTWYSLLGMLA